MFPSGLHYSAVQIRNSRHCTFFADGFLLGIYVKSFTVKDCFNYNY